MTFLQFHAMAAMRGDGLRPELKALLEQLAVNPIQTGMVRPEPEILKPLREVLRRTGPVSTPLHDDLRPALRPLT